jgi:diguanylate cyclase (GGDEF)-like protein/PAS domain S-box-containing protein
MFHSVRHVFIRLSQWLCGLRNCNGAPGNRAECERAFLESVLDNMTDAVVVCDANGTLTYFNRATREIHGIGESSLPPEQWAAYYGLFRPDGKTLLKTEEVPLFRALKGERVVNQEIHIRTEGKPARIMLVNGSRIMSAAGEVFGAVAVMHDITERRKAEGDKDRLASILENTSDYVATADMEGNVLYINRAGRKFIGFGPDQDIAGFRVDQSHPPSSTRLVLEQAFPIALREGVWQGETVFKCLDGREVPVSQVIIAHHGEEGEVAFMSTIVRDISEKKRSEERLAWLAYHDPLTHLPNRFLLHERIDHALAKAYRHDWMGAILFLDLDRFKIINDTLGHAFGDELLKLVAGRLTHSVRREDTVARLGGDEFVVLIEDVEDIDGVSVVAESILKAFLPAFAIKGQEFFVSPSIGIAVYPHDGKDAESLLRNADVAMYRAKELGRNNYRFYTADMDSPLLDRLRLETDLHHALERNQFVLYYQPIVNLAIGRICRVEALLRWMHPDRGLMEPEEFVPLLEEMGSIVPVGEWVIRTACRQVRHWRKSGLLPVQIAVNVSAVQFQRQPNLIRLLADCIEESEPEGAASFQLEIELTEAALMRDPERARQTVQAIRQLGISIAIDDFGTGCFSMLYLKQLPVDAIKPARDFVDGLPDHGDAAIFRAILAMARELNLRVVAQGVESEGQLDFLQTQGCDEIQGHWLNPPLPVAEMEKLLGRAEAV